MRISPAYLSLTLAWLLQTTIPGAGADTSTSDTHFREMVDSRYVEPFRQGDIDKWIQVFDENAIALHNRRPADRGKGAIEAFGRSVQQYFKLAEYDVDVTDIRRSEQWVYTVGTYTSRFVSKKDGSEPFGREQGKFVLLWELQDDQQWRVILDMGNSNQP
jgi:ketosteroid isomerase-like protein